MLCRQCVQLVAMSDSTNCDASNAESNDESKVRSNCAIELKRLETQVGGHDSRNKKYADSSLGVYDLGNGLILKALNKPPRGPRELQFYQEVFSSDCCDADLLELRQFLPRYHGVEEQRNTKLVKLTNLTANFQKPCIADLKMGRITYDREASPEKIRAEESKFPPLKNIGFQITGMMIQNMHTKRVFDKVYTRNLSEENFLSGGLGAFFSILKDSHRNSVIQGLIARLQKLEKWFLKQKKFSFTASSLLMIYEGLNGSSLENLPTDPTTSSVCNAQVTSDDSCALVFDQPLSTEESIQVHESRKRSRNNNVEDLNSKNEGVCMKSKLRKEDTASYLGIVQNSHDGIANVQDSKVRVELPASTLCKGHSLETPDFSVHFIDFAHVFPATDVDENFLFGLQNLISYLQQLLK